MGKIETTPSDVSAEEGAVIFDGPDGVAVTMTPEAAAETSDRLLDKACEARGQAVTDERSADRQKTDG